MYPYWKFLVDGNGKVVGRVGKCFFNFFEE